MFTDEVVITVIGGKGGNGSISFRREKFVPFGGPDGGDGGHGGSVILQSERNLDTLSEYRMKKVFQASHGAAGGGQKLTGKTAAPLILKVPTGTAVYDAVTKELLHDFVQDKEQFTVVTGGRGGYGNAHFTSSTRQAPRFAELGDRGEERKIRLALKLIADVGIIGFPNAGKSSFITRVSAAKPAIANYPFTTLTPHLGIVDHKGKSFVICDNPGLIEGASAGKGLGIKFLKHIERTRILLHMIDGTEVDVYQRYKIINQELKKYKKELVDRPQIVAINKLDLLSEEQVEKIEKEFKKKKVKVMFISTTTGKNLNTVLDRLIEMLDKIPKVVSLEQPLDTRKVFRPHLDDPHYFSVIKRKNKFVVEGKRIEQIVRMTPPGNTEGLERIYDVIKKMGIHNELTKRGAKDGNPIVIGETQIEFRE